MSQRRRGVRASVNIDDVRTAFYEKVRDTANPWAWIREIWSDFLVADNDEGELYKIPWSEGADGTIEFGEPIEVQVQYVPAPPDEEDVEEQEGLVLLSRKATRVQAASEGADDMEIDVLRKRLGLADDADEEAVLAALDQRLEQAPPEEEEEEQEEETPPEGEEALVPEGAALIDSETLADLQVAAASGREAREMLQEQNRTNFIDGVVRAGKLKPSNKVLRQTLERELDRDPKAAADMAGELAVVVPTHELGHGDDGATSDDALYDALFPSTGKV